MPLGVWRLSLKVLFIPDFCDHMYQLGSSLVGIWNSLHSMMETPYQGPIDRSPISISFFLLSWGKEIVLYWLIPTGLYKILMSWDPCLLKFVVLLLLLLLFQIIENKWVSPEVEQMRKRWLRVLSNIEDQISADREVGSEIRYFESVCYC